MTVRRLIAISLLAVLAGCGVETATTAATGAAIKKREIEQAKKTQEQLQQKIEQANQQLQQRADKAGEK
jgi:NifU-like protein involved in Fe-S cluster formation